MAADIPLTAPAVQAPPQKTPSARRVTEVLLGQVPAVCAGCKATAVFVYLDALGGRQLPMPDDLKGKVIYVTKTPAEDRDQAERGEPFIRVPNVPLTRMGQVKMAMFLALARGIVKRGDIVVCLSGIAESGTLDTLIVTEVGREFEMFTPATGDHQAPSHILPQVLERVIDIAAELGSQGREGKPVGALFVIGDSERVLSMSRQLILNPFRGYPADARNILNPDLEETIKELSLLDGAFVVQGDGTVESAGVFLKTASQQESRLPHGLGARHHAAAAITAVTDAIAVTVSESTGTVTVFRNGRIVTEIEKPRTAVSLPGRGRETEAEM